MDAQSPSTRWHMVALGRFLGQFVGPNPLLQQPFRSSLGRTSTTTSKLTSPSSCSSVTSMVGSLMTSTAPSLTARSYPTAMCFPKASRAGNAPPDAASSSIPGTCQRRSRYEKPLWAPAVIPPQPRRRGRSFAPERTSTKRAGSTVSCRRSGDRQQVAVGNGGGYFTYATWTRSMVPLNLNGALS